MFHLTFGPLEFLVNLLWTDQVNITALCCHFVWFTAVGLEPPQLSVSEERHLAILTELPFVVQFEERVKVQHRKDQKMFFSSHKWDANNHKNVICIINLTNVTLFWKVKSAPLEWEFVIKIWLVLYIINIIFWLLFAIYITLLVRADYVKQEPKWKGNTSQLWVFLWPSHWS